MTHMDIILKLFFLPVSSTWEGGRGGGGVAGVYLFEGP